MKHLSDIFIDNSLININIRASIHDFHSTTKQKNRASTDHQSLKKLPRVGDGLMQGKGPHTIVKGPI